MTVSDFINRFKRIVNDIFQVNQRYEIDGWVAREKDGSLRFSSEKPRKMRNWWCTETNKHTMFLPDEFFQSIKWEDTEAARCKIIIELED